MSKSPSFTFTIPSLPKEWYSKLEEVRKELGLTQRQCVIWALWMAMEHAKGANGAAVELRDKVKEKYSS